MRKLVLTMIGKDSEIASAKENIEDLLGHMPFDLVKNELTMDQIDYDYREEYVVYVVDECFPCGTSLEKAFKIALEQVRNGANPRATTINFCVTTYIGDIFEGVNRTKETTARMHNIV